MPSSENNYWLFLEPYAYLSINKSSALLYNTLDAKYIETEDERVLELLCQLKDSLTGTIYFPGHLLNVDTIKTFIEKLREYYMGDIIDMAFSNVQPIQFFPILNIQNSKEKLMRDANRSIGENVLSHLHELSFFMEKPGSFPNKFYPTTLTSYSTKDKKDGRNMDLGIISNVINQIPIKRNDILFNFIIDDISKYMYISELIDFLKTISYRKRIITSHNTLINGIDYLEQLDSSTHVEFFIDPLKIESNTKSLFYKENESNNKIKAIKKMYILIDSQETYTYAMQLIEKYEIDFYSYIPIFNGSNYNFFSENIFLEKDDILSLPISMREIFIHQTINNEVFGKLTVSPSGNVFSNIFSEKLGSLETSSILELLYKEIKSGNNWFKIRDNSTCNICNYKWLCPSPNNYEILLNHNCMCHIKK